MMKSSEQPRIGAQQTSDIEHVPLSGSVPRTPQRWKAFPFCFLLFALCFSLAGCCSQKFVGSRPFDFQKDTFSYANELVWDYHFDANGKWVHERHKPEPDYTHHCFVVTRSARQFFQHATFDASLPVADEATYRKLIHRVISVDPRHVLPESKHIVIPGYANLRDFSMAQEKLLKEECGGAWESYVQRGHWRGVFPFSGRHQEKEANRLLADLKENRPPVVHIVRFPTPLMNHSLLIFDAKETPKAIEFIVYDPNKPESPKTLTFDRTTKHFWFPGNDYWPGGRADVYEIYRTWDY